jgi:predicted RNase H-like HicB family nuclease
MSEYLIVIEKTSTGFSAYSPDIPGCAATGRTDDEVIRNIEEALEFHIEGLREDGIAIPLPQSHSSYVRIAA